MIASRIVYKFVHCSDQMSRVRVVLFNATFNNISVIHIVSVSLNGGGNQ
jgi:hypothetical protein